MKKFIYTIIALLGILMPSSMQAEASADNEDAGEREMYSISKADSIVFYYDDKIALRMSDPSVPSNALRKVRNLTIEGFREYINEGVINASTVIFDQSFAYCDTITSTQEWFKNSQCEIIEGLEYLNTSNVTTFNRMFASCKSLKKLNLSSFDTSNVTDMSEMFAECSKLDSLDVSGFNTENVTNMNGMFSGCSSLTNLDVSNFKTGNVTDMGAMFAICSDLVSLDVSNFDTDNVTNMGWMFSGCTSLTELNISNFNTANVTNMWAMFRQCEALTTLNLGSFNTEKVEDMRVMFAECNSLESIIVGIDGWTTSAVTESQRMFEHCYALVGGLGTAFNSDYIDCTYAHIDGCVDNPGYLTDKDAKSYVEFEKSTGILTFKYGSMPSASDSIMIGDVERNSFLRGIPGWASSDVTTVVFDTTFVYCKTISITSNWFYNCSNLTSVIGIRNFNTEKVKYMDNMFYGCSSLTSLDLSSFKTDDLIDMTGMFYGCSSLTSLDLSSFNTTNVTNMSNLFRGCSSLDSLGLSNFITDNVTDMSFMFYGCSSLDSLGLSHFKTGNVTNMEYMFAECSNLKTLDVTNFKTDNVTSMMCMFRKCSNLTSLDLSGFKTDNVSNMEYMFSNTSNLKTIDVSNFNTDNVTSAKEMFNGCSSLLSLDISSFKMDKVKSMAYMFCGCSNLINLVFGDFDCGSVTIMYCMFSGCTNLRRIYAAKDWNTANVTEASLIFYDCTNLVGGAGTTYDADHVSDVSYTRIDGGADNPGYFTDIADKGKEKKEQVATPTFMFSGDQLYISSETEDAKIFYATSSINGDGTTDANGTRAMTANDITYTEYTDPLFITSDTIIMAKAIKDGMEDSEVNTLTYYYSAWMELLNAMDYGNQIYKQSERNENVSQDLREQLSSLISRAEVCYYSDRATTDYHEVEKLTHHIMEYAKQIEEQMQPTEKVAAPTFGFEGYDLTMATETEGATIRYVMEEWTYENIDSAYVQADKMTVDISGAIYDGPLGTVTHNMIVKAYASKDGMADSDISTLVYYGKAWQQLQDVIAYGERLINEANGNEKVNQELVENLKWALDEGAMMYERRAETPGQEATMWIERISELCKQIEEQLNATTEQVETPKFKFTNNILELVTETLDAKIYYAIQEFDNDLETDTIAKYARNLQVSVDSIEYKDPIEANYDFIIKAMAVKEGMENSKDTTYIYPYTEWMKLLATIEIGKSLTSSILNENPSERIIDMLEILKDHMEEDNYTYLYDRTKWDRETVIYERYRLEDEIKHIDMIWQEEKSMQTTATYENYTLTVEGETTMTQALEQVGGRNVVAKDIAAIVWNSSETLTRSDIEGFGNPNLLIYVQTDSLAPEGVNNVVINGKAKSITLVDAESNNNFYAPMAFTAESISYTREFKQTTEKDISRGWEGIALPFTVQKFTHESHGEIAPFGNDASIFHFWLHQMTDKGMVNATTIEANKPYIISMPNNGSYPEAYNQAGKVTFSAENVTVPVSDNTAIWTADGTIGMMSTYLRIESSEYIYALNVGSTTEGHAEGSVFVQNLREVKPFEVFTFHEENHHEGAGARFISVSSLFGGEGTTGIIDVIAEPKSDRWYDMNGRLLQSKPVRKGVYIKNGKKVVVK